MMISYPGLTKLKTKPIVYQNVILASDSSTLEQLKELSSKRKAIEESINENSNVTEAIAREMSGDLVQSATLFRKAAGVYDYLAKEVPIFITRAEDRIPEATSHISSIMSLICLAEAQAVTARKAEENGKSGSLLAKLHYGITEFSTEAIDLLQATIKDCKDISSRLLDYIMSCKALHELKCYKHVAENLKNEGKIGVAVGVLRRELSNAKKSMPKEEAWRLVFKQVINDLSVVLRKYEHENEFVWLNKKVSAVVSEERVVESSDSGTDVFKLTYLEGNSWLWEVGGAKILVDPILVGNLDFGIPWLYDAAKKVLKNFKLDDLPEIDCLLVTQSLDDHCHLKTLKPLSQKLPNLRVIATPNAKALLDPLFSNVTYLEPGQSSEIQVNNGSSVNIRATAGPVLGPPWQRPENGYIVTSPKGQLRLYYEPHCVYNENFVEKERADIVITPVIKQLLPNFTLVSGQEDAVRLAKLLRAKFIVPMKNGDLDSKGLLSSLVRADGTMESFKEILLKELPDAIVLEPTPGVPLNVSSTGNNS
ncbi:hypothetical protein DH2020_032185 [Rehmannia glutinosa]|uniref:BRO1 domain-containing protein n=1 Tax=Rehmannia glutinosa TaxID=99300 RepID=A0ABR0VHQ9_REHGL